jgi:hypothetical protein
LKVEDYVSDILTSLLSLYKGKDESPVEITDNIARYIEVKSV